ncbi:hypothetical protein [uncultured Croceitalea sp.]|uniref:hypothetical protein n=1 Tax=uncultured Croceitalea sp. TaxID=1798908 RepID=UPI00374FD070
MKQFIRHILLFVVLGLIVGELIARVFVLNSEVPQREIDDFGIQRYKPLQNGDYKGRTHSWTINKLGWPGELPNSYDNLITVIGDSFIENFMNPSECHQSSYLKELNKEYNYIEAARSGVSLIEAMEITKQFDSLNPKLHLIYINDSDLEESIVQLARHNDITQLDLDKNSIVYGKMKSPGSKKILYNWKFIYYLYRRFPVSFNTNEISPEEKIDVNSKSIYFRKLLNFIKDNYEINDKIFVFRPDTNPETIELTRNMGFEVVDLKVESDKSWSFEYDHHWTCYGHREAAKQVNTVIAERK